MLSSLSEEVILRNDIKYIKYHVNDARMGILGQKDKKEP